LLKRGHYVLIAGAVLFVIGIAVTIAWALPLTEQLLREAAVLQGEQVNPGESESLSLQVTDATKPLSIIINSANPETQLRAILETPDGQTAINSTFAENTVLGADPTVQGAYRLTVTNVGDSATSIDVVFGHLPGVEENNQLALETFGGALTGFAVIIAGVIVMIAGGAILLVDRKRVATR
jgi:hypothetical protein